VAKDCLAAILPFKLPDLKCCKIWKNAYQNGLFDSDCGKLQETGNCRLKQDK
jgi:hypothetical protein